MRGETKSVVLSLLYLVATGAKDINRDRGYGRAMDPDMVLGSGADLVNAMALSGSPGHSDVYGLSALL